MVAGIFIEIYNLTDLTDNVCVVAARCERPSDVIYSNSASLCEHSDARSHNSRVSLACLPPPVTMTMHELSTYVRLICAYIYNILCTVCWLPVHANFVIIRL